MDDLLIIAEAGVNHNGSLERARQLVGAAAAAGADMVKFQAFRATDLTATGTKTAAYQAANTGDDDQLHLLQALELGRDAFETIAATCRDAGVEFLCTPFDVAMTADLVGLGMRRIKVASGELTNSPALRHFAGFGLPVILSTGMAGLDEVRRAVAVLDDAGAEDVTVLHCTSLYPTPIETVNLRAMATMAAALGRPVGYSDHTLGDHVAVAAVALGARVIEKHFTLDRALPGPDHMASLEPDELAGMVARLRETALALGDGIKRPARGEAETAALVRRSWRAARDLPAGAEIAAADIALKRPADGLSPDASPVGRRLARALRFDDPVRADDLA